MGIQRTITATQMRSINRSAVLELLRVGGPLSRSSISSELGISLPTVVRIVDGLITEDLVRDTGCTERTGGRRGPTLEFNAAGQLVVGIDLGGTQMFGGVANLHGEILHEASVRQHETSGEESYIRLKGVIAELLAAARSPGLRIRGIGVGVPGVTRHEEGTVTWAPSLRWRDFPLGPRLSDEFGLPVTVENDVNLAAVGELWYGAARMSRNVVLIAIGTGIGAAVILDRTLYRGSHEASGEIGYLLPSVEYLGRRYEGFGALETLASGTGIAKRGREALAGMRPSAELADLSSEDVFAAFSRGETWARGVIEETIEYLALAVANVSALYDPDTIVLGGGVAQSSSILLPAILQKVEGTVPFVPSVVTSTLGRRATVLGSLVDVLYRTDKYYSVREVS